MLPMEVSVPGIHPCAPITCEPLHSKRQGTVKDKRQATVKDIFKCAVVNQYSGAQRFLGRGILDGKILTDNKFDSKKYKVNDTPLQGQHSGFQKSGRIAIPLANEFARGITQSMQRNATPMSNRTTDVNVHFLFEEMELRGLKRPEGGVFQLPREMAEKNKILYEATYSLIVFRMLNRTHPYRVWAREREAGKKYRLPKPDDIGEFSTFLQRTACGSKTESMSLWGTRQFKGKTPSEWERLDPTLELLEKLRGNLSPKLEQFLNNEAYQKSPNRWKKAHEMLFAVLKDLHPNTTDDNMKWMAQMVIGDLEEVFGPIFGNCKSEWLVPGHGSAKCLKYLKDKEEGDQKEWSFANALDEIIKFVNNEKECPLSCLEVMGYGRKEYESLQQTEWDLVRPKTCRTLDVQAIYTSQI